MPEAAVHAARNAMALAAREKPLLREGIDGLICSKIFHEGSIVLTALLNVPLMTSAALRAFSRKALPREHQRTTQKLDRPSCLAHCMEGSSVLAAQAHLSTQVSHSIISLPLPEKKAPFSPLSSPFAVDHGELSGPGAFHVWILRDLNHSFIKYFNIWI
jgi:hypothetical protein